MIYGSRGINLIARIINAKWIINYRGILYLFLFIFATVCLSGCWLSR